MTLSEQLFQRFCDLNGVACHVVPIAAERTPDFRIVVRGAELFCEVKQIEPNADDISELKEAYATGQGKGRWVPNRLRKVFRNVSGQLRAAADAGIPTLLVVYDATPFRAYTHHFDAMQAVYGHNAVVVTVYEGSDDHHVSEPFFGGNRAFTSEQNTSVSALAILDTDHRPVPEMISLRLYHNDRYAKVRLPRETFNGLPVTHTYAPPNQR